MAPSRPIYWRLLDIRACVVLLALFCLCVAALAADFRHPTYDIPYLPHIVIDGKVDDWGDDGYRVEALPTHFRHTPRAVANFNPTFRLGWTNEGIVLFAEVTDDVIVEYPDVSDLWKLDSMEVFVASAVGSPEYYQLDVNTGADPNYPGVRSHFYDFRASKETLPTLSAKIANGRTPDGYRIEALLPWKNLGITPALGDEIGMQLVFIDADAPDDQWFRHVWFSPDQSYLNSNLMHQVRLAERASTPVHAVMAYQYVPEEQTIYMRVHGTPALIGTPLALTFGERTLVNTVFGDEGGRAMVRFPIPAPSGTSPDHVINIQGGANVISNHPLRGVGVLSGRILLPDGAPAVGAIVHAPGYIPNFTMPAVTNDDGYYTFYTPWMNGEHHIAVQLGNYTTSSLGFPIVVHSDGGMATGPAVVHLVRGCEVAGILTDKAGNPLPDARLVLWGGSHQATRTNAKGEFLFEGVPEADHTIEIDDERYVKDRQNFRAVAGTRLNFTLVTKEGAILSGRITDVDSKPIADAQIRIDTNSPYPLFARVNPDGTYTLGGIDPDAPIAAVVAEKQGYAEQRKTGVLFAAGSREMTLDFVLTPQKVETRTITGRITREDGSPVAGASVLYGWSSFYYQKKEVTTDAEGRYTLAEVDITPNLVVVQASGCAPALRYVEPRVDAEMDFTLVSGHTLTAVVVDENGTPLKGVHISTGLPNKAEIEKLRFGGSDKYFYDLKPSAITDTEGIFTLNDLPADNITMSLWKDGYVIRHHGEPYNVQTTTSITLPRRAVIAGTVVNAVDGTPVSQFRVFAEPDHYEGTIVATQDGKFSLPGGTVGGMTSVSVEAHGFYRQTIERLVMVAHDKVDHQANVFALQPAGPLTGTVTDADGTPLAGVAITVMQMPSYQSVYWRSDIRVVDQQNIASLRTDANGQFRMDSCPVRSATLLLRKPGYSRIALRDVDCTKPVAVTLAPGATISGSVARTPGDTGRYYVSLRELNDRQNFEQMAMVESPEKIDFSMCDLAPGQYSVSVSYFEEGARSASPSMIYPLTLTAGETHVVDWDRRGDYEVEGRVTMQGKPVPGVHVALYPANSGMFGAASTTDENGTYRLIALEPGDYRVWFRHGEFRKETMDAYEFVTVVPGSNRVDLAFTAAVSGRVVGVDGAPLANATLRAYQRSQDVDARRGWGNLHTEPRWQPLNSRVTTDADGRFTIDTLRAGEWLVAVETSGPHPGVSGAPFTLRDGDIRDDLTLTVPLTGIAEVALIDAATKAPIEKAFVALVNGDGFLVYPAPEGGDDCVSGFCPYLPEAPGPGVTRFTNLAPGRYTAYVIPGHWGLNGANGYLESGVTFLVKGGEIARPTLAARKGGVLRLQLPEGTRLPENQNLVVGYRISKPGAKQPVLKGAAGPYWGAAQYLRPESRESRIATPVAVALPAGTYRLHAVLRHDTAGPVEPGAPGTLWEVERTIKVTRGGEIVIDIPWTPETTP